MSDYILQLNWGRKQNGKVSSYYQQVKATILKGLGMEAQLPEPSEI